MPTDPFETRNMAIYQQARAARMQVGLDRLVPPAVEPAKKR